MKFQQVAVERAFDDRVTQTKRVKAKLEDHLAKVRGILCVQVCNIISNLINTLINSLKIVVLVKFDIFVTKSP